MKLFAGDYFERVKAGQQHDYQSEAALSLAKYVHYPRGSQQLRGSCTHGPARWNPSIALASRSVHRRCMTSS